MEMLTFRLQGGEEIACEIRRSPAARKLRLGISAAGRLSLSAPASASLASLKKVSLDFLPWLEKNWPKFREKARPALPVGIDFPAMGRSWHVEYGENLDEARIQAHRAGACRLFSRNRAARIALLEKEGRIALYGSVRDMQPVFGALAWWCREQARQFLPSFLLDLAAATGFKPGKVLVGDQRSLWGSCSRPPSGHEPIIRLNWRAMFLDKALLAHLCWHELCHIEAPDHSARFHSLLEARSPDSAALERALGRAWRDLPGWVHVARASN